MYRLKDIYAYMHGDNIKHAPELFFTTLYIIIRILKKSIIYILCIETGERLRRILRSIWTVPLPSDDTIEARTR